MSEFGSPNRTPGGGYFELGAGGVKPGIENPVGIDNGGKLVGMAIGNAPVGSGIAVGKENTGVPAEACGAPGPAAGAPDPAVECVAGWGDGETGAFCQRVSGGSSRKASGSSGASCVGPPAFALAVETLFGVSPIAGVTAGVTARRTGRGGGTRSSYWVEYR